MQARQHTLRLSRINTRNIIRVMSLALLAGAALATQQLQAASNSLVDISHVTLPGNKQQLALTLSGPASAPKAFTIDNPARIALDLADTSNELDERNLRIASGMLQNVTTVEAGGRTRVVINLTSMSPYQTSIKGNQLLESTLLTLLTSDVVQWVKGESSSIFPQRVLSLTCARKVDALSSTSLIHSLLQNCSVDLTSWTSVRPYSSLMPSPTSVAPR